MMVARDAALDYARRGWSVSPWVQRGNHKFPLTDHGHLDATTDPATIEVWWRKHPNAVPSIATGERSGVVILDIDLRALGSGWHSLEALGISLHPQTPTAHSPGGGCHLLFAWPGRYVKTVAGALGPFLDIRGDGGSVILPPGPGRYWDPHLGVDTPLAPMPEWMGVAPPARPNAGPRPVIQQPISRYAEAALDRAVGAIIKAPNGQQRDTLNAQVYGIAQLVAGGVIPSPLALDALRWAALQMPVYDPRRPWLDTDKIVNGAFLDGLHHPRRPEMRR
jgi:putative DNA primase/helicase